MPKKEDFTQEAAKIMRRLEERAAVIETALCDPLLSNEEVDEFNRELDLCHETILGLKTLNELEVFHGY